MGRGRVVVTAVLSVISLAVLSLHVALCLHYPSPLFAVTLLLNPSLWMLLGALGMGCALVLTYRERQRKVRAALCTTCHARYGATVDGKWREGIHTRPRGPSRAVYAYNGISHKFYASYGAMSEKSGRMMKQSATLHQSPAATFKQTAAPLSLEKAEVRITPEPKKELEGDNELGMVEKEVSSPGNSSNPDSVSAPNTDSTTTTESPATTSISNHIDADKVMPTPASEEKLACNCLSRYGRVSHRVRQRDHNRAPADNSRAARHRPAHPEIRTVGKHSKRIVMECRARDPNDVPVHLFTAASQDTETPTIAVSNDSCKGPLSAPLSSLTCLKPGKKSAVAGHEEAAPSPGRSPAETQNTRHASAHSRAPSHIPAPFPPSHASPSQPSPSPLPSPAARGTTPDDDAYHCTFHNLQDPEVASLSSECGLLPHCEDTPTPHLSPVWGTRRAARKERRTKEQQAADSGRRLPISVLLANTRRVLTKPKWSHQEDPSTTLQLSPSSPRKRLLSGSAQAERIWRQRKASPKRTMTSAEGTKTLEGVGTSASRATHSESVKPASPTTSVMLREQKIKKTRPHHRTRQAAGDVVLLLSDDDPEE